MLRRGTCEQKLAPRRYDPLSARFDYKDQEGHKFNLDNIETVDQAATRYAREFLEAWYSPSNSSKRHCIRSCAQLDGGQTVNQAVKPHRSKITNLDCFYGFICKTASSNIHILKIQTTAHN